MVTNEDGHITQNVVYIPFGEVFVEERNGSWASPYLFNAKELDEETGLYYYGARYLDPTGAMWLSVDPLFEKYAGMSPYNYCAGNPVKLVDPDGRAIYYNTDGDRIGSSANGEEKYIVTNSSDLKMLKGRKKQYTELSSFSETPFQLPSDATLKEAKSVMERTESKNNKGSKEEVSLVHNNGSVIVGQPGEPAVFGQKLVTAPLPENPWKKEEVEASIHSHPSIVLYGLERGDEVFFDKQYPRDAYFANEPSSLDKKYLSGYKYNIIVGKFTNPKYPKEQQVTMNYYEENKHVYFNGVIDNRIAGYCIFNSDFSNCISLDKKAFNKILK